MAYFGVMRFGDTDGDSFLNFGSNWEIATLLDKIHMLEKENQELKTTIEDRQAIIERRAQLLANARFKKMNSDFEDVRKAFGRTCIENDELKKKIARLDTSAKMRDETLSDRVTNLTNELNVANSAIYLYKNDIKCYEKRIAELSTENHKMDVEIHELKQENYKLKDELHTYQASLEEASQQNDKLGKELEECKKSFEYGLSECSRLQKLVDEYRAYIDPRSYENYCGWLEEVEALRKTVDNQAETIKEDNEQIQYWVAEYKKLESQLTAKARVEIAQLKKANEGLQKTNQRRKKLINNLYGKNAKLQNEYGLMLECHQKLAKEFNELNEEHKELLMAHSNLSSDYAKLDKKYKSMSPVPPERLEPRTPAYERRGFA